jgi:Ca2+-binding EF-hand superfamily protein
MLIVYNLKADLDKAATALKHSAEQFRQFVNRFDRWLIENHDTGIKIFQTFDTERTGKVTYGQFKSGI